jgi:hypothetical protein
MSDWPTDKVTALRLGQRLVAEVPSAGPGRRAFVDITPHRTPADAEARGNGWNRTDDARTFTLRHWDYDAGRLDGYDYDIGAFLIRTTTVVGEPDLVVALRAWRLHPGQFQYPWQTDDPQGT